jgi:hypothetical protein
MTERSETRFVVDNRLQNSPYTVEFDQEKFDIFLKKEGLPESEISGLTIVFSPESLTDAGSYRFSNKLKKKILTIYTDRLWRGMIGKKSFWDVLSGLSHDFDDVLLHESRHMIQSVERPSVFRVEKGIYLVSVIASGIASFVAQKYGVGNSTDMSIILASITGVIVSAVGGETWPTERDAESFRKRVKVSPGFRSFGTLKGR